jgi:large subunit ribosomal protein L7/L12
MATASKLTPKDFVDALKEWTVLDIQEALRLAEEELGIKPAAAAVAAPAAAAGGGAAAAAEEPAEEQTEFTVTLTQVGDSKINVIKAVREITGLGLKEAKDLVDASPKPVKENVNKEEADSIAAKLKDAGATAEIK